MRNALVVARPGPIRSRAIPIAPTKKHLAMYEQDHVRFRQIGEFSTRYLSRKRKGIVLAATLIAFSAACLFLFSLDINVAQPFSIGALLLLVLLFHCAYEFSQEGIALQRAYHAYLREFPREVLLKLQRSEQLSAWSRYEIERYMRSIS